MEKIKDILHDFSDIFIAFIIAGLMFGVVAWNLGDWFNKDNIASAIETNIDKENTYTETSNETSNDLEIEDDILEPDKSVEELEKPIEITIVDSKTITIPTGTPGMGIARILFENGLIESPQDFVKTAEDLGLALTLKSGTFEIPTNASIEDIVKIIAGRN